MVVVYEMITGKQRRVNKASLKKMLQAKNDLVLQEQGRLPLPRLWAIVNFRCMLEILFMLTTQILRIFSNHRHYLLA